MKTRRSVLSYLVGDMRRYGLLTKDEEATLVEAMLAGDTSARDKLILANTRIALKIAKEFERSGVPVEDLSSAAMCGLVRAIDKYRPGKSKLTYFIGIFVRGELIQLTTAMKCLVKVGTTVAQQKCVCKLQQDEDVSTAAARIGVTPEVVAEMKVRLQGEVYLDERFGPSDVERLVDTLEASTEDPLEAAERNQRARFLRGALAEAKLSPRQRQILDLHVVEGKTLRALTKELQTPLKTLECELAEALLELRCLLPFESK